MKLLTVSHACVTPINQAFYADLARLKGWEVELVVPATWNSEYTKALPATRWKDFNGVLHTIPTWKSGNIPLHVYRSFFVDLLRRSKPDAIYMHHEPYGLASAQVYFANALTGRRPIGFYAAQNILKQYPPPFRWLESYVMRSSQFCFPVSQGALDVLRTKGYTARAAVLPLAVDANVYRPQPEWAAGQRRAMGLGEDTFVIGYLGRLVEEKGLRNLLLAASQLPHSNWSCVFVGTGPFEQELRALAATLGIAERVHFVGFVPHEQAPGWLTLFDVLVLASETRPNWKEQFGRVIVEANACGTPVIGTESGEIGHVLRDTAGGLVVPEADVAALQDALARLAGDPALARRLGELGAQAVRARYDQLYLAGRFAATIEAAMHDVAPGAAAKLDKAHEMAKEAQR
jgi:glycosyltransferase involved in cell wall biosynthesis